MTFYSHLHIILRHHNVEIIKEFYLFGYFKSRYNLVDQNPHYDQIKLEKNLVDLKLNRAPLSQRYPYYYSTINKLHILQYYRVGYTASRFPHILRKFIYTKYN